MGFLRGVLRGLETNLREKPSAELAFVHPGGAIKILLSLHVGVGESDMGLNTLGCGEGSGTVLALVHPVRVLGPLDRSPAQCTMVW